MLSYLLGDISTMMSSYLPVALPDLLNELLDEQKLSRIWSLYQCHISVWLDVWWLNDGLPAIRIVEF